MCGTSKYLSDLRTWDPLQGVYHALSGSRQVWVSEWKSLQQGLCVTRQFVQRSFPAQTKFGGAHLKRWRNYLSLYHEFSWIRSRDIWVGIFVNFRNLAIDTLSFLILRTSLLCLACNGHLLPVFSLVFSGKVAVPGREEVSLGLRLTSKRSFENTSKGIFQNCSVASRIVVCSIVEH